MQMGKMEGMKMDEEMKMNQSKMPEMDMTLPVLRHSASTKYEVLISSVFFC